MALTIDLGIIIAVVSLFSTVIVTVLFFGRIKWDNEEHAKKIVKLETDINNVGAKINDFKNTNAATIHNLEIKVDSIDKAVVSVVATVAFIKETIQELKDKLT